MLGLDKEELAELAERSDKVMEYKKKVDEVNNDDEIISWFTAEEERKMYQDALIEQSKEEGIIQGKKAGLIEGEQKKANSIAKNMLADGMHPAVIARLTNLSEQQISKLM